MQLENTCDSILSIRDNNVMCVHFQASDDKRTQREIADIAGVADVTIRQSYKLMLPRAAELFPPDFRFITPIENLPQN